MRRNFGQAEFPDTRWTLVFEASRKDGSGGDLALAEFCGRYWYPIYAFARRSGHSFDDAEDLTQLFFQRLFERDILSQASRERGRLRSFLLRAFKNVLSEEYRRGQRAKRGGGATLIPIDTDEAEARFHRDPASPEATPEQAWERNWAVNLLDSVFATLRAEYEEKGKAGLFDALREHLAWNASDVPLAETAAALEMTDVAVRVAIHRLRKRFRSRLEDRIAQTVDSDDDIDGELDHLMTVFQN